MIGNMDENLPKNMMLHLPENLRRKYESRMIILKETMFLVASPGSLGLEDRK